MLGRRGRAMPGSWGLAAIRKKRRAAVLPPREDWNFCDIGATNVKETRLGEPVLGEPVLIGRAIKRGWGEPSNEVGRAIKRGWGEPSNEVGRASTKPLGEPVLSRWASHSTTVASTPASKLRLGAFTVPARHVPARHI